MTRCKHCAEELESSSPGFWKHATGDQAGRHTCAVSPYGFHAEPEGEPCRDAEPNPCIGARGWTVGMR